MGRELMRTPAQVVGAHDLSNAPPEPALDEPAAGAPIARGGMAALRDPRVRGAIGNRAVGRVLSRQPAPPPTKKKPEPKSGAEFHIPGGQYEYAYKIKWGRASASFKSTASWQPAKGREDGGPRRDEHLRARGQAQLGARGHELRHEGDRGRREDGQGGWAPRAGHDQAQRQSPRSRRRHQGRQAEPRPQPADGVVHRRGRHRRRVPKGIRHHKGRRPDAEAGAHRRGQGGAQGGRPAEAHGVRQGQAEGGRGRRADAEGRPAGRGGRKGARDDREADGQGAQAGRDQGAREPLQDLPGLWQAPGQEVRL